MLNTQTRTYIRLETLEDRITPSFGPNFDVATLTAATGVNLDGFENLARAGNAVGDVGDVNGDGIPDFAVVSSTADGGGSNKGQAYIIFGNKTALPATIPLNGLNGTNGFTITSKANNDLLGLANNSGATTIAALGDVNGDGIDDFILGAGNADGGGTDKGEAYVIFGSKTAFPASFDLNTLNGSNGFTIVGTANNDELGEAVSSAGDFNADGKLDILVGAPDAGNGKAYVIFGTGASYAPTIDVSTLNGANGFSLEGIAAGDDAGESLAHLGDVNGDGISDIIIGAGVADGGGTNKGQAYIVFGSKLPRPANFDLGGLNGLNGFTVTGLADNDRLGQAVSEAGDFNGDGLNDILIGADGVDGVIGKTGETYLIHGSSAGFPAAFNLATLNGTNGVRFPGSGGDAVSGGRDLNGDGLDDIVTSADGVPTDASGTNDGAAYVIFGARTTPAVFDVFTLDGTNGFRVVESLDRMDSLELVLHTLVMSTTMARTICYLARTTLISEV